MRMKEGGARKGGCGLLQTDAAVVRLLSVTMQDDGLTYPQALLVVIR